MKKFYNSADLCTTIMRSEYTNSDNSFFYNTFVPIAANNNEEAIQSIKHIKSEIKKISDEDMKKNNLNILAPSLLNSQLYVTKLMNVQTSEQLIINFLEYDFTSFSNYFSFFLDFGFLSIVSPVKSSDIAMFRALSITTLNELLALAYKYYEKDKNNLISYQEEYKKIINFIFNLDNNKNLNDLSPHNLLFLYEILHEPESSSNIYNYTVSRRDIDINHHMHNLCYLDLAYETLPKEKRNGRVMINASSSYFVPKPFTPFQWAPMIKPEEFTRRAYFVKDAFARQLNKKSLKFSYHDADITVLEGVLARGDRKLSKLIYDVYKKGAIYDAWTEFFDMERYKKAFEENNIDIDFYISRERADDEIFPWEHIDVGVSKKFLLKEWHNAKAGVVTPNCRMKCSGCGAAVYKGGVCFEAKNQV